MPAFNTAPFIGQAIESVLAQTYSNFELIIIDDGSQDGTLEIAEKCARNDDRIKVLENKVNQGLVYTRNRCIKEAKSPLLAFADSDDVFDLSRIEKQKQFMDAHPDIGVLGANVSYINSIGEPVRDSSEVYWDDKDIRFFLMLGPCIVNTVTMYRRKLLLNVGGYRQGFDAGAEDYDLWSRLLKITSFANLESILASVRLHSSSVTANDAATKNNIYPIARSMLSDYLKVDVSRMAAEDLVILFWHGLGKRKDISEALHLASMLKQKAARLEAPDTYKELCRKMHIALWIQAQSQIYLNRKQSLVMTLRALSLNPGLLATSSLVKYAIRWLTPDKIRLSLKKILNVRV